MKQTVVLIREIKARELLLLQELICCKATEGKSREPKRLKIKKSRKRNFKSCHRLSQPTWNADVPLKKSTFFLLLNFLSEMTFSPPNLKALGW